MITTLTNIFVSTVLSRPLFIADTSCKCAKAHTKIYL